MAIVAIVTDLFFRVQVMDAAKAEGTTVYFADSVDKAVELARREKPALLLADLNCRDFDPVQVARQLKADLDLAAIPMLGFVSHVQEDRKREALQAGFDKVVARSAFAGNVRKWISDPKA